MNLKNQSGKIEPFLTSDEVANYLRLKRVSVQAMAREGRIPAHRIGRIYRFSKSEIDTWVAEQKQKAERSQPA